VISDLGRFSVLIGLTAASVGAVAGLYSGATRSAQALTWARAMTWIFGLSATLAVVLMEYALFTHDFSVGYVAEVGSRSSPAWVTAVSLWSSLNGSILLWAFVLGFYLIGFERLTRGKYPEHTPWALGVGLVVAVFFQFLVAGVANPFNPVSPVPEDGPGPNPLLQNHILMVIHPPMLYLGYVGMTVPFAVGSAALLAGRLDAAWSGVLRRWTLMPWMFLTVGIILGGWWSYEVLGWGGWWAWDPVENASFMPWLTSTAFLHSAVVMERKDELRGWTLTLVLSTFLLTILGTFMTRSGVFNSVHSFTQSDIGPVFLGFLAVSLVFCLVLVAARVDQLAPAKEAGEMSASRETGFLVNNLLFTAFTFTVLVGTVFPLLNEAITGKQLSVGQPYFDAMSAPISLAIVFLMGIGPALPWGRSPSPEQRQRLIPAGIVGLAVAAGCLAAGLQGFWAIATLAASAFAGAVTVMELVVPARARARSTGESLAVASAAVFVRARRRYGGYVVHIGVLLIAVAHASATAWSTKDSMTFATGQTREVQGYSLTYLGSEAQDQPHRRSVVTRFAVKHGAQDLGELQPRLNTYKKMGMPIATPEVESGLDEDLYLSLVNVNPEAGTASLEVLVRPLVWWLWAGGAVMMFGTFIAMWPQRQRERTAEAAS